MIIQNEIIINQDKTLTVIGELAHKIYWNNKDLIQTLEKIIHNRLSSNMAWVIELDGTVKAGQRTKKNAIEYMNENRILIYSIEGIK